MPSKYSAPGVSCYPGILLKLIQYRALILLTVKDSKTFLTPAQRFKMESKRVFNSGSQIDRTRSHIFNSRSKIIRDNMTVELERERLYSARKIN